MLGCGSAEGGAELGLSARAVQKHDEDARDFESEIGSEVLFDECQREIDAGRDPGRGIDGSILHVERVALDRGVRNGLA